MDDHELLRNYVQSRSQDAFRQLVERHLPMVYATARRMVHDAHLAEDVAQNVFTTIASKGATIHPPQAVGGWLYNTTRHLSMHVVRSEQRRREREQVAVDMQFLNLNSDTDEIIELLEPAMAELEGEDGDAIMLRFMENRTFQEVGIELGISEDAARMRVNRALERLRSVFVRRGVTVSGIILGGILTGSSGAVPSSLAATITATAFGTAVAVSAAKTTLIAMNWINAKGITAIVTATIVAGTSTYWWQQQKFERLRSEKEQWVAQTEKAKRDHEAERRKADAMAKELETLQSSARELHQLRNQVSQLRKEKDALQVTLREQAVASVPTEVEKGSPAMAFPPGTYIPKDKLTFAGYDTPEAGLQSLTYAMLFGTYEMVTEASGPEVTEREAKDPKSRASFEQGQKKMAPLFKGYQLLAKKVLSDDVVELKFKMDADPLPEQKHPQPDFFIQPMKKFDNQWKLGGSTRNDPQGKWDQGGQIETFTSVP